MASFVSLSGPLGGMVVTRSQGRGNLTSVQVPSHLCVLVGNGQRLGASLWQQQGSVSPVPSRCPCGCLNAGKSDHLSLPQDV